MYEHRDTRCIHGDLERPAFEATRAVSFPIYQTATFGHIGFGKSSGFDYTRETNPTRGKLEETMSSLEGAVDTCAFSSGMAAVSACFELLSPGQHIVCSEDLYGGVIRLFDKVSIKNGLSVDYVDTGSRDAIEAAITQDTAALYIETPSNPMMNVADLRACHEIAEEHGLLLIVDNTFLSPYLQNPIELGADLVIHSGSKFIAGHNDTISGFVSSGTPELAERIRLIHKTTGAALSPFDSWHVLRGIKTLGIRMERQESNAQELARWLSTQPGVAQVFYVGLEDHPGYAVNASQARGAGAMISFRTDTVEIAHRVLERVKLITFAESLGGTESLITYPMVQTHPDVPEAVREHLGITDTLLRLSVGLENVDDLKSDLSQALSS
ncbi:trans-sulfuration enzyme family protein [Ancrocorticia populi]|uniref:Cystathionine gamma-synthase n=1 Tax=Ancrocorticia populi TaxID=2175228 RepID=A0A2V1K5Y0_9ACTO|nr:PLP-dependent aspartate aminotransferase family protein [Ancrocorticia populi]PWF26725.1 cystathionine gamma-synthase [Ancrocorticia populi]